MADRTPSSPGSCCPRSVSLAPLDTFPRRHLGSDTVDIAALLEPLGQPSLDALIDAAVPPTIRLPRPLDLPAGIGESAMLAELRGLAA